MLRGGSSGSESVADAKWSFSWSVASTGSRSSGHAVQSSATVIGSSSLIEAPRSQRVRSRPRSYAASRNGESRLGLGGVTQWADVDREIAAHLGDRVCGSIACSGVGQCAGHHPRDRSTNTQVDRRIRPILPDTSEVVILALRASQGRESGARTRFREARSVSGFDHRCALRELVETGRHAGRSGSGSRTWSPADGFPQPGGAGVCTARHQETAPPWKSDRQPDSGVLVADTYCLSVVGDTRWRWAGDAARLVATVEVAFAGLFAFPLHIGA